MILATLFHLRVADTLKEIDIASLRGPSRHIYVEPQLNKQRKIINRFMPGRFLLGPTTLKNLLFGPTYFKQLSTALRKENFKEMVCFNG